MSMDKQDIRERFKEKFGWRDGKKLSHNLYTETVADWWLAEMESILEEKRREIEGMKKEGDDMPGVDSSFKNMRAHGYNQAVADILSHLSTPVSNKK